MSRETTTTRIKVSCLRCEGRGWLTRPSRTEPAERCACSRHLVRGPVFSLRKLARMLGEDADTLARVWLLRARPETCERVLTRLQQNTITSLPSMPVGAS
jgi:hypothetical protein